jgi:signal transduction histidine kinase/ActR/RegA family two-component response regulator
MTTDRGMRVLHLEDSDFDAELVAHALKKELPASEVLRVQSRSGYEAALGQSVFDVILADFALAEFDGLAAFGLARQRCPDTPFILVSGAIGEENASEAMRRGVADYVMKDRPGRLVPAIRQALQLAEERRRRRATEAEVAANARRAELLVNMASRLFLTEQASDVVQGLFAEIAAAVQADAFWFQPEMPDTGSPTDRGAENREARPEPERSSLIEPVTAASGFPAADVLERSAVGWISRHRLQASGPRLGLLVLGYRSPRTYSAAETAFLRTAVDLVAAHLERNRLLAELRGALSATERASRAKDDFLAALSHELRTPLNPALLLASDGAANPQLTEATRRDFGTIAAQIGLESRLIDDLLELTRVMRNEDRLSLEELELTPLIEDAMRTIGPDATAKAIAVERELGHDGVRLNADRARLHEGLWRLLDNAVKFTPTGGRIVVRTRSDAHGVSLSVIDNGVGMSPEELERAFDPFVRGEEAGHGAEGRGGLGLGLAITRRIVELHHGRIHANSAGRGAGSTFMMWLPADRARASGESGGPVAQATASAGASAAWPKTLLLVEDHPATREALGRLLRVRGFEVNSAGSVAEARTAVERQRFDLVLSDIGLPDGNGLELMTELHRQHGLRGIALSGYRLEAEELEAAGFVGYLTKPVRLPPLMAEIERAAGRHAS